MGNEITVQVLTAPVAADQRLADAVLTVSAVLLTVLGCWLMVCLVVEVVQQVRACRSGQPHVSSSSWRPEAVRSLVALVVGSALAVPLGASAAQRPGPTVLDGLPLPDRVPGNASGPAYRRPPVTLRVRVGDSLWRLAAERLPASRSAADVDRAWRHLYACNRTTVGPDPDLLHPGIRLRVPRHL